MGDSGDWGIQESRKIGKFRQLGGDFRGSGKETTDGRGKKKEYGRRKTKTAGGKNRNIRQKLRAAGGSLPGEPGKLAVWEIRDSGVRAKLRFSSAGYFFSPSKGTRVQKAITSRSFWGRHCVRIFCYFPPTMSRGTTPRSNGPKIGSRAPFLWGSPGPQLTFSRNLFRSGGPPGIFGVFRTVADGGSCGSFFRGKRSWGNWEIRQKTGGGGDYERTWRETTEKEERRKMTE